MFIERVDGRAGCAPGPPYAQMDRSVTVQKMKATAACANGGFRPGRGQAQSPATVSPFWPLLPCAVSAEAEVVSGLGCVLTVFSVVLGAGDGGK